MNVTCICVAVSPENVWITEMQIPFQKISAAHGFQGSGAGPGKRTKIPTFIFKIGFIWTIYLTGLIVLHFGKSAQPQNFCPAHFPLFALRSTTAPPPLGQAVEPLTGSLFFELATGAQWGFRVRTRSFRYTSSCRRIGVFSDSRCFAGKCSIVENTPQNLVTVAPFFNSVVPLNFAWFGLCGLPV